MSTLIDADGGGEDSVVLSSGQPVSMQLLQQIYKEATGKTERITKQFDVNHRTNFSNIENLNFTIEQLLEQYHVKEKVCTVTFFHTDDCSERFSSFDRSRAYEAGSGSPIENVRLEYNFLIVLPVVKKPQSYKITVDIISRAALLQKLRAGHQIQRRIMQAFASSTGSASIEYVDYAVARAMMGAISGWFEALESKPTPFVVRWLQRHSHNLNWIFKYATAVCVALAFYRQMSPSIAANSYHLFLYAMGAFSSIFILSGIAFQAGELAEQGVDGISASSNLELNQGDRRVNSADKKEALWSAVKVCVSLISAVSLNMFASWLAVRIGLIA